MEFMMSQHKKNILKEKLTGIILCLVQLLLTMVLLSFLLVFKFFDLPVFITLAFILFAVFAGTFLSQQSKNYRMAGKYIALGLDLILIVSCITCFAAR
jgi:cobalamin biosynthesis protein CobD/CbiB